MIHRFPLIGIIIGYYSSIVDDQQLPNNFFVSAAACIAFIIYDRYLLVVGCFTYLKIYTLSSDIVFYDPLFEFDLFRVAKAYISKKCSFMLCTYVLSKMKLWSIEQP